MRLFRISYLRTSKKIRPDLRLCNDEEQLLRVDEDKNNKNIEDLPVNKSSNTLGNEDLVKN